MSVKKITDIGRYLLDTGLLFEINRTVLHPFGLALEVSVDEDKRGKVSVSSIWDCRDDPEGIVYGDESFKIGHEKFNRFLDDFGNERLRTRKEILGYLVQSINENIKNT